MSAVGQATKDFALRLARDVLSRGDLDAFEELFAEDYVNHNIPVPGIPGTKDGFRELVKATSTRGGSLRWTASFVAMRPLR